MHLEVLEVGLLLSILLFLVYGRPNYDKAGPTGPYSVGFKEFTTREHWNDCSVFYPVDKDVAARFTKEGQGYACLLRYPKSLGALATCLAWLGGCPKGF